MELKQLFEHATNVGSLIQVPDGLAQKLPALRRLSELKGQAMLVAVTLERLEPLLRQAELLAARYDDVVANPPYMGRRNGLNSDLKKIGTHLYPKGAPDLYAMFIERSASLSKAKAHLALLTMHSWLFLLTYSKLREHFLVSNRLESLAHFGPRAFKTISGEVVQVVAFSFANHQGPRL